MSINGFYDGLMMQLKRAQKDGLLHSVSLDELVHVEPDAKRALRYQHTNAPHVYTRARARAHTHPPHTH